MLLLTCLPVFGQNLLTNGDFANADGNGDPTNWLLEDASIVSIDTSDFPAGAVRSLKIDLPVGGGSSLGQIRQSLAVASSGAPLTPNSTYLARVRVKSTASGQARLQIKRYDASNNELERIDSADSTTGWTQVQAGFNTGSAARVEILLRYKKNAATSGQAARFANAELLDGSSSTLGTLTLVPTFSSIGVYAPVDGALVAGTGGHTLELAYRPTGGSTWTSVLPGMASVADNEFRGSVLLLQPNTSYDVQATLKSGGSTLDQKTATVTTWADTETIATDNTMPSSLTSTYTITAQGTSTGWVRYKAASGGSTIDVGSGSDYAIHLDNAAYVVIDGLTLKGGKEATIHISNSHHIRIRNCDISGWSEAGTFAANEDPDAHKRAEFPYGYFNSTTTFDSTTLISLRAGIYVTGANSSQVVIERNLLHHPVGKSASWIFNEGLNHPAGPSGIVLEATGGNHVIRDNDIVAGAGHFFNDAIESKENQYENGGPYRDTDISGNLLAGSNDDGTELDGGLMNVRYWRNWVEGNSSGLSAAPALLGPAYVFRNLFVGGDETGTSKNGFKLGGQPGVVHFVNNTVITPGYGLTAGNYHDAVTPIFSRNNLFTGPVEGNGFLRMDSADSWSITGDIDYDLYPVGGILSGTTGWEPNGVAGHPDFADAAARSLLLAPNSPGIGQAAGVAGLTAAGDDLGAISTATSAVSWPLRAATPNVFPARSVVRLRAGASALAVLELEASAATGSTWKAIAGEPWLTLSATTGSTGASPQTVSCTVNASSLAPGLYRTFVSFRTDTGALRTALLDVEVLPATDIVFTMEAEANELPIDFEPGSDSGASGGSYAHALAGDFGADGGIRQTFNVSTAGNYYVHIRVRADGPALELQRRNSFFLIIDDVENDGDPGELRWDLGSVGTDWSWQTAHCPAMPATSDMAGPIGFTAGAHNIKIKKREAGLQLDVMVVSNSPFPPRVEAPSFNPAGGTFSSAQSVSLSSATSGATIRYTTDGSTPTRSHGTIYSGAVNVSATTVLKAVAYTFQLDDSPVTSDLYTIGGGSGGGGSPFLMSGNEVAIEAEHFSTATAGDGHDWTLYTQSGASGGASDNALRATPNDGTGYPTFDPAAARVEFAIDVPSGSASSFYVHLRGLGATTTDDSVYLSIDGATTGTVQMGLGHSLGWQTSGSALTIPSGQHTLTIWMREDGAILDKVVVNNSATTPSGTGPAESAQGEPALQPDANGLFVMEAENYTSTTASTDDWTVFTLTGASGAVSNNAVRSTPNDGTAYATFDSGAARLDYLIEAPSAGNYYVHLRDYGATSTDDSVYVSIDGGSTTQVVTAGRSLDWKSSPGTLAIPAGLHTVTIWDREDGIEIDKIVVSASATAPSGNGPPESARN